MGYFNRGDAREGKGDDDGATGAGAGECTVTPEMTPAPPEVPPPRGVMLPSSPPGVENPQAEDAEDPPDNELLQPGRTRARTRAYHQASTTARPADHAVFNQAPPKQPAVALSTCDASQL